MRNAEILLAEFVASFNELMDCWEELNPRDEDKRYMRLTKAGMNLLLNIAEECHFRDKFEAFYSHSFVLDTQIKSTKTDSVYFLGYDIKDGSIYFLSYIHNPQYIKNLQDKFLVDFFSRCQQHGFQYIGQRSGTSGKSIFHNSIKSNIFRLFRDYTADVLESEEGLDVYQNCILGHFEKKWNCNMLDLEFAQQFYHELCSAMKCFYQFNYHLWKCQQSDKKCLNNQ